MFQAAHGLDLGPAADQTIADVRPAPLLPLSLAAIAAFGGQIGCRHPGQDRVARPPEPPPAQPADVRVARTATVSAQRLRGHVYGLGELRSAGPRAMARSIAERARAAGLRPGFGAAYLAPAKTATVTDWPAAPTVAAELGPAAAKKVAVLAAGFDPAQAGADALSGIAVTLQVCHELARRPRGELRLRVRCLIEVGPPARAAPASDEIVARVDLGPVGHLRGRAITVAGHEGATSLETLMRSAADASGLALRFTGRPPALPCPTIEVSAPAHPGDGPPGETADTLDYPGMARIGDVVADLVRTLASVDIDLTGDAP